MAGSSAADRNAQKSAANAERKADKDAAKAERKVAATDKKALKDARGGKQRRRKGCCCCCCCCGSSSVEVEEPEAPPPAAPKPLPMARMPEPDRAPTPPPQYDRDGDGRPDLDRDGDGIDDRQGMPAATLPGQVIEWEGAYYVSILPPNEPMSRSAKLPPSTGGLLWMPAAIAAPVKPVKSHGRVR